MNPWRVAAFCVFELIAVVALLLAFHERGYQRGKKAGWKKGYHQGHQDADNWWIGIEQEANKERLKIWKEERP